MTSLEAIERDLLHAGENREGEETVVSAHFLVKRGTVAGADLQAEHFRLPGLRSAWAKALTFHEAGKAWAAHDVLSGEDHARLRQIETTGPAVTAAVAKLKKRSGRERAIRRVLEGVRECDSDRSVDFDVEALAVALNEAAGEARSSNAVEATDAYEVMQRTARQYASPESRPRTIPTPWPAFNEQYNGGLKVGSAHLVGAPTSGRKTTACLNYVAHAARMGKRCLVWTLEDDTEDLVDRLLANATEAPHTLPSITQREFPRQALRTEFYKHVDAQTWARNIKVIDRRGVNRHQLFAGIRAQRGRFDVVFVDFLQLVQPVGREREDQHLLHTMAGLAEIAQEQDAVVVVAVQLSQDYMRRHEAAGKWPVPTLGDIRGASAISQAAHTVIMLRPPPDNELQGRLVHDFEAHVRKSKNGPKYFRFNLSAHAMHDRLTQAAPRRGAR